MGTRWIRCCWILPILWPPLVVV
uniref:Uncharacterized protein n=1 Tax=Anguilla anguilla TaxID=7936 RepID=A0A0E9TSZ5_ANGAN